MAQPLPMDPSSKIPTWSTNYSPLGAEQGQSKPLAT